MDCAVQKIAFGRGQLFDVIGAGTVFPGSRRRAAGIGGDRLQYVFVGAGVRRGLVYAIDRACKGVAAVAAGKGGVGGAFLDGDRLCVHTFAVLRIEHSQGVGKTDEEAAVAVRGVGGR